jgi:hypothetical protein
MLSVFSSSELWTVGRVCLWPNALFTGNHIEYRVPMEKGPDDGTRQTIRREIEDAFAVHLRDDNTRLPSTVFLVTARRPR